MSRVVSSVFGILLGVVTACLLADSPAHALDQNHVVINLVQVADSQSANDEVIEIYNNDLHPVEVTNWCLYYASATSTTNGTKLACIMPTDAQDHIFIDGQTYVSFASKQYVAATPLIVPDMTFSAILSGTAGHLRLLDANGAVVDKVGWGATAVSPEGLPAQVPSIDQALVRAMVRQQFVDTDNNVADLTLVVKPSALLGSGLYDEEDLCVNLDGIQFAVPDDLIVDDSGNCVLPVTDSCPNVLGTQAEVPVGYELRDDGLCWLAVSPLRINELLPNPGGTDAGNEFIELYNPTDQDVALMSYLLKVGQNLEIVIKFTHGEIVPANGYLVIQNNTYTFSLLNSSDLVALVTADGQPVDQTLPYTDPDDGFAWALFGNAWQYTSQPTPGAPNLLSLDSVDSDVVAAGVALAPCATNQYRNPATGRCKLLAGQSSTLVPCKSNQTRSAETGRCHVTATTTGPAPCPAGQERNADTSRCRKIVLTTPPKANYAVLGASTTSNHNYVLWAVLGVLALGIAYAIWEWHEEMMKLLRKARRLVGFSIKHN